MRFSMGWYRVVLLVAIGCSVMAGPPVPGLAQEGLKATPESDLQRGDGLDGEDRWQSPQFGTVAGWDRSWRPTIDQTWSSVVDDEDRLKLEWADDPDGELYLVVRDEGRGGPQHDVEIWTSEDFLAGYREVDDLEILLSEAGASDADGGVLIAISDAGLPHPLFHYKHSMVTTDGRGMYVLIEAPGPIILDVLAAAEEGVLIEGEPVELVFPTSEIEAAIVAYDAVPFSPEAAGLTGEQHYQGPVCGVSVEWADSWQVSEDMQPPVLSDPVDQVDELYLDATDVGDYGPYLDVQSFASIETPAGDRIDSRTNEEVQQSIWGPSTASETVLREVGDGEAEALVVLTIDGADEVVYEWARFTWLEEAQCNAYLELTAPASAFEAAWLTVTEEFAIEVNGGPLTPMLTWDEIDEAMTEHGS